MSQVAVIYPENLMQDGVLTLDSTIPVSYPAWDAAQAYNAGDYVIYGGSGLYRRLFAGTTAAIPTSDSTNWALDVNAAVIGNWASGVYYAKGAVVAYGKYVYGCVIAGSSTTVPSSDTARWSRSARDYPHWGAATTYAIGDRISYNKNIYECLISGASATRPDRAATNSKPAVAASSQKWLFMQKANAWLAFDGVNATATRAYGTTMVLVIRPKRAVSAIAITGLFANTIRVQVSGLLDETVSLIGATADRIRDVDSVTTYYKEFAHTAGLTITITITSGSYAQCGSVVVGAMQKIGDTLSGIQYGASLTTNDYSKTTIDDFGNVTVIRRPWAKDAAVTLMLPNELVAGTQELISYLRATPCMWRLSDVSGAFMLFGFARDFSLSVAYPKHSFMQLAIKGLI